MEVRLNGPARFTEERLTSSPCIVDRRTADDGKGGEFEAGGGVLTLNFANELLILGVLLVIKN